MKQADLVLRDHEASLDQLDLVDLEERPGLLVNQDLQVNVDRQDQLDQLGQPVQPVALDNEENKEKEASQELQDNQVRVTNILLIRRTLYHYAYTIL